MIALLVALGAAVGAPARFLIDRAVQRRHPGSVPGGTLTVNTVACVLLGAVTGLSAHLGLDVVALLGTGFCGTLSTYSTFSFESMTLAATGHRGRAALYVCASLVAGIGGAALAWTVAGALG
jgi:CrcB protein